MLIKRGVASILINLVRIHSVWKGQKSLEALSIVEFGTIWTFGSISIKIEHMKKIGGRKEK